MKRETSLKIFCLITFMAFLSARAGADRDGRSQGSETESVEIADDGNNPYGAYLGCLNRARVPIAPGLNMTTRGWDGPKVPVEKDNNFFYGTSKGRGGFFYITPTSATFTEVPLDSHPSNNSMPGYHLSYKDPQGHEYLTNYYLDKKGRGEVAGTVRKSEGQNNTPFKVYPIGLPQDKISDQEAQEGLVSEILPRLEGMPKSVVNIKKYIQFRYPGEDVKIYDEAAKEALCACMKVKQTSVVEAAHSAANALGYKDMKQCGPQLTSQIREWISFLPEANAVEQPSHKVINKFYLSVADAPVDLRFLGNKLVVCTLAGQSEFSLSDGKMLSKKDKCSLSTMRRPTCASIKNLNALIGGKILDCASEGHQVVAATETSVMWADTASQKNPVVLDTPQGHSRVAVSAEWLAWTRGNQVFVQQLKSVRNL